jgi:TonB family protein
MRVAFAVTNALAALLVMHCAIATAQQSSSPDFVKSIELNTAAIKLFGDVKYHEALPLETEALALREKALGPDHVDLLPLMLNLGEILKRLGKLEEAGDVFNRALKIGEKAFGPNDIEIASIIDRLAFLESDRQRLPNAESLFERSLKIKQAALSKDDSEIAETALNLGQVRAARTDYKGAASTLRVAITIWEAQGETARPNLLKALSSYVLALTALGRNDEAAKAQHRVAELSGQDAIVNGGILNGKALVLMTPAYPQQTGHRGSGTVRVRVLIDVNGHVATAKAIESEMPLEFARAAERAAKQSRFSPTFIEGKPVAVSGVIIYNFVGRYD